jgi:glycyl-tRNA synthetase beta chain
LKLTLPQEKQLAAANGAAIAVVGSFMSNQDFAGAMRELAKLRGPIDAFFTYVTVNAEEPELRIKRLQLLNETRNVINTVADLSKITG